MYFLVESIIIFSKMTFVMKVLYARYLKKLTNHYVLNNLII